MIRIGKNPGYRVGVLLVWVSGAWAMFAPPSTAPVARLVANTEAYLRENPKDANAHYTLGRIHYLAFALNSRELRFYQGKNVPSVYNALSPGRAASGPKPANDGGVERMQHITEALRSFDNALELEPKNSLVVLGVACLYEDAAEFAAGRGLDPQLKNSPLEHQKLQAAWRERAIERYLEAYNLAIPADDRLTQRPVSGIKSLVSYEAGQNYVRLVKARGVQASERTAVARIEQSIAKFAKLPMGAITPVVLTFRTAASLDDLLDPQATVRFDLDGTGRPQRYPWLRPDTAMLAWDPERSGKITSGRQLFGTVTWWMFWENGYRAMDALDDDRDGWLRGVELRGLALWFDQNRNGVSDPGEVLPIEQSEIAALSTRVTDYDGASPMSRDGLILKDGRTLPTWDWVVGTTGLRPVAQ